MEKQYRFRSRCPILNCSNEEVIYWKHGPCGDDGIETIDINGNIQCMKCW